MAGKKKEESDMGKMALGVAAAIAASLISTPASAGLDEPFTGNPNANIATFGGFQPGNGPIDGRFDRRHGNANGGVWVNGGEWARYNNQAWQSSGFNDWWHDRPDRAYPAWMRNNQDCAKQWYAGSTLRC
jgi:hypothetical protein